MPTYEYECCACGHSFERFQAITAKAIRKCPKCGKRRVKRLVGAGAGVLFKGSGFYQTDYRSESYLKDQKAETADTSAPKVDDKKKPSEKKSPKKAPKATVP